jgi:hypothetical protein
MPWWIRLSPAAMGGELAGEQEADHFHGGGLLVMLERAEDQAGVYGDRFEWVGGGEVPGHPFGPQFALWVGG